MKWIIKNPAPSDSRRRKWGDFHFGRSLTRYLTRLGHEVESHYDPDWDQPSEADVVLVLRGKYPFPPAPNHGDALRVMWNISHPGDVSQDEYATYDLVCVASRPLSKELADLVDTPVHPLLQCTDHEEFHPRGGSLRDSSDVIFVGNTRDIERPGVLWALDYGLPLKIWGRGWESFGVPREQVVADYLPNEELGGVYASSRATLNDHWDDMKRYGFVNNRIFDALACHLPVVSDWHPELEALVPGGVLFYRDRFEFEQCLEAVLLDHPRLVSEVVDVAGIVREQFSFEHRTHELVALVENALARS